MVDSVKTNQPTQTLTQEWLKLWLPNLPWLLTGLQRIFLAY